MMQSTLDARYNNKSLTVNCLVLFMTYWHKVKMSCRKTQPVVLQSFHLPLSRSYLTSLEKASPIHTWPAGRLQSHVLEDTCTNADGWHEWKIFQIGDFAFGFPTRSIAHHEINVLKTEKKNSCAQTCQSKRNSVYRVWGNLWIRIIYNLNKTICNC